MTKLSEVQFFSFPVLFITKGTFTFAADDQADAERLFKAASIGLDISNAEGSNVFMDEGDCGLAHDLAAYTGREPADFHTTHRDGNGMFVGSPVLIKDVGAQEAFRGELDAEDYDPEDEDEDEEVEEDDDEEEEASEDDRTAHRKD